MESAPLLRPAQRARGRLAPLVSLLAAVAVTLAASAAVRPVRRAVSAATGGAAASARFGVESFEVVDSGHRNRLARLAVATLRRAELARALELGAGGGGGAAGAARLAVRYWPEEGSALAPLWSRVERVELADPGVVRVEIPLLRLRAPCFGELCFCVVCAHVHHLELLLPAAQALVLLLLRRHLRLAAICRWVYVGLFAVDLLEQALKLP